MNQVEYTFFHNLLNNLEVTQSSIPKSILKSINFNQLLNSNILTSEKAGKGRRYSILKLDSYKLWLSNHSHNAENLTDSKANSVAKFRNSKVNGTKQTPFYFIRGFEKIEVNGIEIDLAIFTKKFDAFLTNSLNFIFDNVCIVENKESFLMAEKLFDVNWIFIHKYGRWSEIDFIELNPKNLMVFGDYDLVGLHEYLEIKKAIPHAKFYIPENFDELFNKFSRNNNKLLNQNISEKVKISKDDDVVKIRELVTRTNRFLEQEALFII